MPANKRAFLFVQYEKSMKTVQKNGVQANTFVRSTEEVRKVLRAHPSNKHFFSAKEVAAVSKKTAKRDFFLYKWPGCRSGSKEIYGYLSNLDANSPQF
ncbi:hypothetical protein KUF54_08165 [Comamonas sp. Y33R10-2]|uniref:hypothetical protein n=1 Tax=Comamonas sp. Y33R10-2 TaxID=2853257 RepID=UPI001C5CA197|nr:hypothetical protein [Comamonas sp. Y33R10-2]QXZ11142.1 hypothetical protein KUF54_08165 [Comamonas sp. Y33R10-2]